MVSKVPFDVEASATCRSIVVLLITHEWFSLPFMNYGDMLLKCVVLSELLAAPWKCTSELLPFIVQLFMPFQSCGCNETLTAAVPLADIIPFVGVCRFDMVFKVG